MAENTTSEAGNEDILNVDSEVSESENVETIAPKEKEKEEDFKAKYYYLAAEFDNMKKRFEREKENLLKFGNEKILSNLVGIVDNFDLTVGALKNDNDDKVQNIVKGIDMIRNQFLDVLKQSGLTQVESLGKTFDPNFHERVRGRFANINRRRIER